MTLLLDADSMIYIIAYNNREGSDEEMVRAACAGFFRDIFTYSQCDNYIGVFSDKRCFRDQVYKFASYKGNRKEKPDYIEQYGPVIKEYFQTKHNFITVRNYEADDVVVALATNKFKDDFVIASPDKDLRQIGGLFLDYGKPEFQLITVSVEQANYNFWLQMLTGDSTDNVAGIPGLGDVKGKKILAECMDPMQYGSAVRFAYTKYFGSYYGPLIYMETFNTLQLVKDEEHPNWSDELITAEAQYLKQTESIFDN